MKKIPDLIITADWHLRDDIPSCRKDNYWKAQEKKLDFIMNTHPDVPLIIAGDIFHKASSSKTLETWFLQRYNKHLLRDCYGRRMYYIPGNHDLINHNINDLYRSSIGVLDAANYIEQIENGEYFCDYWDDSTPYQRNIKVIHELISNTAEDFICRNAYDVLEEYKDYDLIITGDNHKTFVVEKDGRLLVNPGSIMRMRKNQKEHKPCIFLYYAEDNTVEQIFLPIEVDVFKEEKPVNTFVETLDKNDVEFDLSYKDNLKQHIKKNGIIDAIEKVIWENVG